MKLFKVEDMSVLLLFLFKEYSYSSSHRKTYLWGVVFGFRKWDGGNHSVGYIFVPGSIH